MTMGRTIRKSSATFGLYFACIALCYPVLAQESPKAVLDLKFAPPKGEIGKNASFNCSVLPDKATVEFLFNGKSINANRSKIIDKPGPLPDVRDEDGNVNKWKTYNLTIANVTKEDAGNYTCVAKLGDQARNETRALDLQFTGSLVDKTKGPLRLNVSDNPHVILYCVFEVYAIPQNVLWYKKGANEEAQLRTPIETPNNMRRINSTYDLHITANDSATYVCEIKDEVSENDIKGEIDIIVYAAPQIVAFNVTPINTTELYINWIVKNYNSPIEVYSLATRESQNKTWVYIMERIYPENTSFVVKDLKKSTEYQLRLEVKTKNWTQRGVWEDSNWVKTLDKEPVFVPNISIKGFSATSVTIGWPPPPDDIAHLIHYYTLDGRKKDKDGSQDPDNADKHLSAFHPRDGNNLPFMFANLDPHSSYVFQVQACSDYSKRCGPWSDKMEAATLDGIPGKPSNVLVECTDRVMNLTWGSPVKPNAEIKGYFMELTGNSTYRDRFGTWKEDTWGPFARFMANDSRSARLDDLQPNSNYTVRLSAMTRSRRRGDEEVRRCTTPARAPDVPPRPRWRKILESNRYMFKMYLPRITERNGPICCYRVHMVRMRGNTDWMNLPPPKFINIITYADAHLASEPLFGAYVTDIFSNDKFPSDSELILGDSSTRYNESKLSETDPTLLSNACLRCLQRPRRQPHEPASTTTTTTTTQATTTEEEEEDEDSTTVTPLVEKERRRRSLESILLMSGEDYPMEFEESTGSVLESGFRARRNSDGDYNSNPVMRDKSEDAKDLKLSVIDGFLDSKSNYTMFVELIPGQPHLEPVYSDYVNTLMPAPSPPVPVPSTALELALQVTCAVAGVVLLGMIVFCVLQTRRSRKLPPHATVEMNRIQQALRYVVGHIGGRQQLLSAVPPDMPPIAKDDLAAAYAERQVDSDYGFQKEFELLQMLPECFPDRTTHASEARENQPKNRYPDIKAYDQTRVKLSQIDSVTGSDYINANYVMGYRDPLEPNQERKQFICAQGPTDTTVNDFWRMIWEHGLELIVMLTNLEEYSKVKCSKYWPDEVRGARAFGAVTVHHVSEKRYSDYIVRELKITKQPTNSEGQPIVENNGVAKRNGDCKEASESSAPTSPREAKETEGRIVRQYHFLMWKDFAAPEHPHSILKFIKRVNEAWAGMVGRPVVVHCSAGVGRTGTLVALDCLLEQLRATGQASVFNTVAELRRQRNFLVQSLKQYVFVYRALVEWAHYGDTEIPAARLKAAVDRRRTTPDNQDKCILEHEFEKMINSPVAEPVKSCAAGAGEEVRGRNRSADCLPYDRNRVILTPLPGRDFSTYINASFIEAYDNSEGFIITQDPLPNTIMDFWRMVSEHNVSTIVMLSEIGEGKCPRYWDDGTAQYEHISVQYEESESCPYYTRRQFRLTNNKNGDTVSVRQLQYQGWPTAPGHVPEVTRGLAELADAARAAHTPDHTMLVHCHLGTERSALFVALCLLICQLRVERRVDVNVVARKVRAQRARTIDTFLQYEFLHRAILNYAELHNLLEDS